MFSALSPARRRLVVGASAAVLAAAVAGAVVVVRRSDAPGPAPAPQDRPGPVLLVPGFGGSSAGLEALARRLRAAGRQASVVPLPGNGTGDLAEQAVALGAAVGRTLRDSGARSVDVVGYSAGGVVARLWVRDGRGAALVRRVLTLGSPHHGTDLAGLVGSLAPDQCPAACRELAPESDLLRRLNAGDETPDGPSWVSVWSTVDEVVTPPDSARLAGAVDVTVQQVCPGSRVRHSELPTDPVVQSIVLAELAAGPAGSHLVVACPPVSS